MHRHHSLRSRSFLCRYTRHHRIPTRSIRIHRTHHKISNPVLHRNPAEARRSQPVNDRRKRPIRLIGAANGIRPDTRHRRPRHRSQPILHLCRHAYRSSRYRPIRQQTIRAKLSRPDILGPETRQIHLPIRNRRRSHLGVLPTIVPGPVLRSEERRVGSRERV